MTIQEEFKESHLLEADLAVHEVGRILEGVIKLAAQDGITSEKLESVKSAVNQLFDSYGKVDAKLHGGQGSDYHQVAADIQKSMDILKKVAKIE